MMIIIMKYPSGWLSFELLWFAQCTRLISSASCAKCEYMYVCNLLFRLREKLINLSFTCNFIFVIHFMDFFFGSYFPPLSAWQWYERHDAHLSQQLKADNKLNVLNIIYKIYHTSGLGHLRLVLVSVRIYLSAFPWQIRILQLFNSVAGNLTDAGEADAYDIRHWYDTI